MNTDKKFNEPADNELAEMADQHYTAHAEAAKKCGMTPQQCAIKHKESPGGEGMRARLHLALHAVKLHDSMKSVGGSDDEVDAATGAVERSKYK